MIELPSGFSKPYKQLCAWNDNSMLKDSGTVTAREMRPYVKSQQDATRYAGFFNFSTLFVCLLADMVRVPSEIRNNLNRGHAVILSSARTPRVLLSSFRIRR
jgi:hypothetical protein